MGSRLHSAHAVRRLHSAHAVVAELRRDGVRLGNVQQGVLRALLEHGGYPGGWMWDTHSQTVRVLEALAKRDLVSRTERPVTDHRGREFPEGHPYHGLMQPVFTPTLAMRRRMAHYNALYRR